ncbi:alpha/beta hydrolase [Candidatus Woesearchaeota archaeon]|nr:alpha/beta hydrolase [Candidatus Neomarinimicrobiota bacterium]MBT4835500.1 alpha/beta hydrolase [Candidatus Woesearchaeota archaeon]
MAPVAEKLSSDYGVIEPFQTEDSIKGQVEELKSILDENSSKPVNLIGWSWGAWLAFIFTAKYPQYVKKLILVGSGPFEENYTSEIMKTRFSRLTEDEKVKLNSLMESLNNPSSKNKVTLMKDFGKLMSKADSYQEIPHDDSVLEFQLDIYQKVWSEASELRKSSKLLEYAKDIKCPVVAIHGDYDPHPFEGVKIPLSNNSEDFKFYLLNNCGHHPWYEKLAKEQFYEILKSEIE